MGLAEDQLYADRYELISCLGRGGMGEVWLAFDRELQSEVALKFLKESISEERAEILRRETRLTRVLSHRYILRVHDFIRPEGGRAAISMEYSPGGNLHELLSKEKPFLEVWEIEDWVHQTCEALSYLHEECGIVHRDIKPSNLMLDLSGKIKVADFGLSAFLASLELDDSSRETIGKGGTLHFASPQMIWNPYESHHLNDIYALGVSIFQLLTGTFPFIDPEDNRWKWDPDQLLSVSARRAAVRRFGEVIPEHWDVAVARCLAEDPLDRPASARELSRMLAGGKAEETVDWGETKRVESPIPLSPRPTEKAMGAKTFGRVLWIVVIAGLFGLLAGILLGLAELWKSKGSVEADLSVAVRSLAKMAQAD